METNSENKIIQMWSGKDPFIAPQHFKEVVRARLKNVAKKIFYIRVKR